MSASSLFTSLVCQLAATDSVRGKRGRGAPLAWPRARGGCAKVAARGAWGAYAPQTHATILCLAKEEKQGVSRRAAGAMLATLVATVGNGTGTHLARAEEAGLEVLSEEAGIGQVSIRKSSLVLLHYVGTVTSTGEVFDSTRGGLKYLNMGEGVFRPIVIRVNGDPQPGIVEGLQQGVLGMTAGGKKTFKVPSSLGFGSSAVKAPYSVVPADSELQYEVEILRVSNSGPDELMKYISQCGMGGAGATDTGCADIVPM